VQSHSSSFIHSVFDIIVLIILPIFRLQSMVMVL